LAAPDEDESVGNPPETVPRPPDAALAVPAGFKATLWAEGLADARYLEVMPNGDVLLSEPRAGKVTVLRDESGAGRATCRFTFAEGLAAPHGIAFHDGYVYVADTAAVRRYRWNPADGTAGPAEPVTPMGVLGEANGHVTRNIVFAPDGQHFFVAIGSRSNTAEDPAPRATIRSFATADGVDAPGTTYAAGLRNPIGMRFYPGTGDLWAVVNERDGLGNGLVPDYLVRIAAGGFYGWPYAYIGAHKQPGTLGDKRPDLVAATIVPDLLFQSHSAPIGLVFYDGSQFPAEYRGDAFVTLHGSWNAVRPTGYKVVRLRFKDGKPVGGYENFATGFRLGATSPAKVWGRPTGIAIAKDGSLLIADDVGQTIWRIAWAGP
jgi:glucose/arabinose dehydrogenase